MDPKKFRRPPANVVYQIDGASYGLDDSLVEAVKSSISRRLRAGQLEVPRLPQVAERILHLSQSADPDLGEVHGAIATDPLLAAKVLTVANSAAYATAHRVDGLDAATMRLGFKAVREIVLSESIRIRVFSTRSYRDLLEQSWRLSIGTAIACDTMAAATGLEKEGAFLLGLLHDTGIPVLATAIAEIERGSNGRALGSDIVEIVLTQLHEEIGAYVLGQWGLPESFVIAAREHHRYRGHPSSTSAQRLVYAGNLICEHLGIGREERGVDFTIERVFADIGLADSALMQPILERVRMGVEAMTTAGGAPSR